MNPVNGKQEKKKRKEKLGIPNKSAARESTPVSVPTEKKVFYALTDDADLQTAAYNVPRVVTIALAGNYFAQRKRFDVKLKWVRYNNNCF